MNHLHKAILWLGVGALSLVLLLPNRVYKNWYGVYHPALLDQKRQDLCLLVGVVILTALLTTSRRR